MESMQRSQEETKNDLKEGMRKGLEVVEENIEKKVEQVEERIREQVDERIEEVAGNFSQRVEDLEKKLLACGKMTYENKFVPTSPISEKLSTYDGKTGRENKKKLAENASEVERLANLAFSDHPATVREVISLQYFMDGLKDGEIQKAVRMADVQDLKSALLYALKLEAATQTSHRNRHYIRGATVAADAPWESP
ncbi:uncharacterized protein TNCV_52401 [Trichonephila clavipes]|nr:uncharacterized protein TNCV_52401 [Trichonephila clavipes]